MAIAFYESYDLPLELTAYYSLMHMQWLVRKVIGRSAGKASVVSLARLAQQMDGTMVALEDSLARLIFDYLALACMGEARHAAGKCEAHLDGMTWAYGEGRGSVVAEAEQNYDPWEFLPKLIDLFTLADWNGSYGGPRWGELARSALLWLTGAWNNTTLIDHCVDLVHNGGLCFDKGFLLGCSWEIHRLKWLLDDKASRRPLHRWRASPELGGTVLSFIRKLQDRKLIKSFREFDGKMCIFCGRFHSPAVSRRLAMFSDGSGHDGLPFFDTAVARKQTLADTGYLGIPWRRVGFGAESVGDMVFGRPYGYHDDDDDDDDDEESNHGGCEFNSWDSCDGDCPNCDYYHGGCENNGWEQCDGECSECPYGDTLENKYDDMVEENSKAADYSAKQGIYGHHAGLEVVTSKKFTREEKEL